jgi:hypothetical protein
MEQLVSALRGQGIDPELAAVGLAAPGVLVLGAVVDKEQEARCGQALDEAIEQGLRLAVDPVQVLEDDDQGLDLALAQEQALDRVEGLVAPLERIEGLPGRLFHWHVEECEERRYGGSERRSERQGLAGDLLADLSRVVAAVNLEVAAEQLDHGKIRGGLAVGDGGRLHHQPAVHAVRVKELPKETRLAHARLPDHRDHLAVPPAGPVEGAPKLLQLHGAADEAREPPPRCGLEPSAGSAGPHELEYLDRLTEPLDRYRAERGDLDEALGQVQCVGGEPGAAGRRELLHPGRQVGGLAHGGVVHPEIAANRAHHDVARVETDADLHLHALRVAQLLRVAPHGVLHPEGGIAGTHRMILVRDGRAEERHDAVAHHLVDRALVAVDRFHHAIEHGIEDLTRFLWIAIGEELHRALQGRRRVQSPACALPRGRSWRLGFSQRDVWGCRTRGR